MTLEPKTAAEANDLFNRPQFRPWYGGEGEIQFPDEGHQFIGCDEGIAVFVPMGDRLWEMHIASGAFGVQLGAAAVRWLRETHGGVVIANIPAFNLRARHGAIQAGARFVGEIRQAVVLGTKVFALRVYAWDS